MSFITEHFFNHNRPGRQLLDFVQDGSREVYAAGLGGSAPALVTSLLFDRLRRQCVVVAAAQAEARELYDELCFFRGRGNGQEREVLLFPPLDTQPYENVLSHCDISAQRMWTLYRLCDSDGPCLVVTCVRALYQKIIPPEALIEACVSLKKGDECDRDALCSTLIDGGYTRVSLVEDRGDLSVRGELIDIFPPGYDRPVRIDFFGDSIDSIRLFDPVSQRSRDDMCAVEIVPVREIILGQTISKGIRERRFSGGFDGAHHKARHFFENLSNGLLPPGAEYCLSYLYPQLLTLCDYVADPATIFIADPQAVDQAGQHLSADVEARYRAACDEMRFVSEPSALFIKDVPEDRQRVYLEGLSITRPGTSQVIFSARNNGSIRAGMAGADAAETMLSALAENIETWLADGLHVVLICHTRSQCERLAALLHDYGLETLVSQDAPFDEMLGQYPDSRIQICVGHIARGFQSYDALLALVTEEEIFGEKKRRVRAPGFQEGRAIADFSDLHEGNYVVHRDNGIGIYRGLMALEAGGSRSDYLSLEYLGGDKLYLPADRINLITRYEGADDAQPRLDKLGGTAWKRVKKRVKEAVEKIACELINLYSARKVYKGHAFAPTDHYYHEFEAAFPFEETPDQVAAISDVMSDMGRPMPMDRLICGDVGYGKTEVALRAAFRCVMEGKQVAVLVPTTVLAQQHYQTFTERFKAYPVRVDIISRFRIARDQKTILADLAAGKIDVIIGTHRLVQRDVVFKDLGLLVIDEEHRFGVRHKERLKQLKTTVDVLTLTATPIPRTLQLSLLGMRDFSIIETPPEDRLSIRTVITHFDEGVLRDAILRELKRGGQVFFVHDRVRSIEPMAQFLRRLVPEMNLGVAHGQMNARELEKVMMGFVTRAIDVLLCTTIVESGLDFPTANTIIINNAHRLGLAQMYQLRGRVGRGKVRAYAYIVVPGLSALSRDAAKRIEALSEFTELGSGYRLATRDLQIRGAGHILGHSQSGQIAAVGIDMYLDILNETITELKGETTAPAIDPEINLKLQAYIPEDYVSDVNQRLVLYRRIAAAMTDEDIDDFEGELSDRFGMLPESVRALLDIARMKNVLRHYRIVAVDMVSRQLVFTFHEEAGQCLDTILALVASDRERYRLTPDHKLFARCGITEGAGILGEIRGIFKQSG